jgi:plastocyanin
MRRRFGRLAVLAIVAGGTLVAVPMQADAGGGCHADAYSVSDGDIVTAAELCFVPAVVRVEEGTTIRFLNEDGTAHMFTGVSETFGDFTEFTEGEWTEFRFDANGVYPFYCLLHPGMVGTVLVGDGSGDGPLAANAVTRVDTGDEGGSAEAAVTEEAAPQSVPADDVEAASVSEEPAERGWWTGLGLGIVAAAGIALLVGSRRRRAAALSRQDQPA